MRMTALTALFLIPSLAMASTVLGNPTSSVVLTDVAEVYVDHVVAEDCFTLAQTTFDVDATLEENDVSPLIFDADEDYCALTVHLRWAPGAPLVQVPVDGFTTLSTGINASAVEIELHAASGSATLVQ